MKRSKPLPLPEAVSDPTAAGETTAKPRGKTRRLLQRFKKNVTEQISRFKHFISREPAPNVNHEGAPLTPNIEVQNTASGVKEGVVPKSAVAQVQGVPSVVKESVDVVLQAAGKAAGNMKTLGAHVGSVASAAQNGPAYLDTANSIQDYLQPLRIFNSIIERVADV
ncbi:hypothetical protein DEU56DRAFT_805020 [Suillus clintonianus]|uniref:uncharacterized protein n=1 Tax=Suillus clintonianus TaxID=1904413 RepID=UPI001B879994|nr:uncharacterized protein DEU56DRAFT_805020 [Suillus clintonianus]KAG2136637.1 hypothetical protein DEU56DRAFT_805020 [Suillus clintonianus]